MIIGIDDLVTRLVDIVKATNSDIVPKRRSVVHDGFVVPAATALAWDSALNAFSQGIQSLDQILVLKTDTEFQVAVGEALNLSTEAVINLLSAAIDRRASDMQLRRKDAVKAYGTAYFYTTVAPTTDITVPGGTKIETSAGVQYITLGATILMQSQLAAYYDPELQAYSIAVPVEAMTAGSDSNISAQQLIYASGVLPNGFTGVTNKYIIDTGREEETDEELVDRIKTTQAGVSLQTANGLKALVLNNTDVRSVFIADASSPFQVRNGGKGGVADIYTLDNIPSLVTDQWDVMAVDQYFKHQPVVDVVSVIGVYGQELEHEFLRNTDYVFVKDTGPATANSVKAYDKIQWIGTTRPTGSYRVSYAYNQVLETIQNLVMSDQYRPLMGDVSSALLTREGAKILLEVSYQIVPIGAYSADDVKQKCVAAVSAYINSLTFGASLSQSDIINVLENTTGVNSVNPVPIKFNKVGSAIQETIAVRAFEYLRAATVAIY